MKLPRITTIHINALVAIFLLAGIAVGVIIAETITKGAIGCSLGEVLMICIGGIVWCAKAFAAQGAAGNGDAE